MSVLSCPTGLHRAPASTGKTPVAVEYALTGDLRFLSHHDEMRMLARAAIRARWPIAYSGGFNPIPRLSIALPRPVGLASQCQLAMIQLTHPRPADELRSTLNQSLPRGCSVTHLNIPGPSRAPQPTRACYEVELSQGDAAQTTAKVTELLSRSEVWIARTGPPQRPPRKLDIRPYLETLEQDGPVLRLRLLFDEQRSARPTEVLEELQLNAATYQHHVRLITVEWDRALNGAHAPPAQEGTYLDREQQNDEVPRHNNAPTQEKESRPGNV